MTPPVLCAVVLDTGPLGVLSKPKPGAQDAVCNRWLDGLLARPVRVVVPEIADYEVRRELLRAGKTQGIVHLDALCNTLNYLPLDTTMMRHAAELWANVRSLNLQTADPHALDGDVILAAQTLALGLPFESIVVATGNPAHIARFATAKFWPDIS